jgi:hypothetical protein
LQNGIHVENISLPNIKIKQLYIKWNEKLNVSIEETTIVHKTKNDKSEIDIEKINKLFKELSIFNYWFESVVINKIAFNDISGAFNYKHGENGFLIASSPDFLLKSSLYFESGLFNIQIDEFRDFKRKIEISGNIILDSSNLELVTSLNININNDISLNLFSFANKERLLYKLDSLKNIKDINYTMKLLNLHKDIKYWAYEAIKMSHLTIDSAHGWLDFNNMGEAYKNIYVSAVGHNLSYTYNPNLDAIHSKTTELEFKDGVLNIHPKQAYSYGYFLDKSWLNIDFTQKEELLTLYLLFDAKLDKEILNILNTYKIKVPFLQNSGITKTDLKLTVGLRNIEVQAKGDFFTKKANFDYLGLKIDIFDAHILLDNYDVSIKNMLAQYKDIASTNVNVKYDAQKGEGKIYFDVKDINFKDFNISLNNKIPLNVTYSIAPQQDNIEITNSSWLYQEKLIQIDTLNIPFSLEKLVLNIPSTKVIAQDIGSAYISGTSELKTNKVNLEIDLVSFLYKKIKLLQSNTPIHLNYENRNFRVMLDDKIQLAINGLSCELENALIDIKGEKLHASSSLVDIDNIAHSKLIGDYDFKENMGSVQLEDLKVENKKMGELFSSKETIDINISKSDQNLKVTSPKFDINFLQNSEKWSVSINSLEQLSKNSKILQDYNITTGDFNLYHNLGDIYMKFMANIKHPYKLLVDGNEPIEEYVVTGRINNETKKTSLNINDGAVKINIDKEIRVKIKDIGINVNSLIDFLSDTNSSDENNSDNKSSDINDSQGKNIILNATNSYLFISKDRHVISDKIYLQYHNKSLMSQLKHDKGNAIINYQNYELHIYGEGFNEIFMNNLFALSKFKGGSFDFSIDGTLKEYDGLFYIKETTVMDYKILSNILAFVNTVPSLVTFSLPGYSSKGLNVSRAYMNFHAKDNSFDISDIFLDSQEIDILGRGTANINSNSIDLLLNLKTNLGSSVSQVPLVGYILLDGNTISTTLSVTGNLDDPDVHYLVAKDIVVAPLNIIKRVLLLPYNLINSEENNGSKGEKKED